MGKKFGNLLVRWVCFLLKVGCRDKRGRVGHPDPDPLNSHNVYIGLYSVSLIKSELWIP